MILGRSPLASASLASGSAGSSAVTLRPPIFTRFTPRDPLVSLISQPPQSLALLSAPIVYPATFGLHDWPVPKGPIGGIDLRTWTQNLNLVLEFGFVAVPRAPVLSKPSGPSTFVAVTSQLSGNLSLLAPPIVYPPSFGQHNWPNPFGPRRGDLTIPPYPTPLIIPPIIVPSGARCIYYFSANWAQRPQLRQDRGFYVRYIKQTNSPIWSASFYDRHGLIVATPLTVTLTVNYQTRNGPATDVLPMTQTGIFWRAQWENAAITLGRSIATWEISAPSIGVLTSGFFQVFSNFPQS